MPVPAPPRSAFTEIDVSTWSRRPVYEFYKDGPLPQWGVTVRLDVTALRRVQQQQPGWSFLHASLYLFSRTANEYAPMRYRMRTDETDGTTRVVCYDTVHPSMTILRPADDTYGFCAFCATDTFAAFQTYARAALVDFHAATKGMDEDPREDVMHGSVLPWLDFSNYEHAHGALTFPSIPKYTFGKLVHDKIQDRWSQSLSLHVHHGLMDGLHVGRFVEKLQANLDESESLLLPDGSTSEE
jgi:chloramphenicol O-acetyltransferase type A